MGRPRIQRDPNDRVPMSTRIRGEIFNKLGEAAESHKWPLGREVEQRLESSFAPDPLLSPELRRVGLEMIAAHFDGGPASVVRRLMELAATDEERWDRWQRMYQALIQYRHDHPSVFPERTRTPIDAAFEVTPDEGVGPK